MSNSTVVVTPAIVTARRHASRAGWLSATVDCFKKSVANRIAGDGTDITYRGM